MPDPRYVALLRALEALEIAPIQPLIQHDPSDLQGVRRALVSNRHILDSHCRLGSHGRDLERFGVQYSNDLSEIRTHLEDNQHQIHQYWSTNCDTLESHFSTMIEQGRSGLESLEKMYDTLKTNFEDMIKKGEHGLEELKQMQALQASQEMSIDERLRRGQADMKVMGTFAAVLTDKYNALDVIRGDYKDAMDAVLQRQETYERDQQH